MKLLPSLLLLLALGTAALAEEGPKLANEPDLSKRKSGDAQSLFNGKDLDGWAGNEDYWSVQNGVIVGKTTAEKPLQHNTFLVWTDGTVENFELTFKYKLTANNDKTFANSGMQYRSRVNQPGESGPIVSGYQADCEAGPSHSGILYEERGRGILAKRGQKVTITADPGDPNKAKIEVTGSLGTPEELQAAIKANDWNDYKVIAKGNHLQHFINGKQMVDVTDNHPKAATDGILALQIHKGEPMQVECKDIVLTELK